MLASSSSSSHRPPSSASPSSSPSSSSSASSSSSFASAGSYSSTRRHGVECHYAETYRRLRQAKSPPHTLADLRELEHDVIYLGRLALDYTNHFRISQGLPSLFWHSELTKAGQDHSKRMASGAVPVGHQGFKERISNICLKTKATAENVGMNLGVYNTAEEVVKGWIDSPGHRANLVGDFDLCGIAVARAPSGAFYYTQLFAATG
eukprot:GHVT01041333.1.p1 GENE.GHVT01041333.1~~GHVT01041333.1.p1  ORF type:complete len:206 (-),score=62.93 GHVT01041333.1:1215-1832(-)